MVDVIELADASSEEPEPGITAAQLAHGERLHAQHVTLGPGAGIDGEPHSHPHEQLTYVLAGRLVMTIDGEEFTLSAGDSLVIPGDTPHMAHNDTDEEAVLLDVFTPPREDLLA